MCHVFSGIPTAEYDAETRSVRLGGHSTSIRLETMFWRVLEELAAAEHMTLPRFLTVLYDEVLDRHGEARNFTSLLRCACRKHLEERVKDVPVPAATCPSVLAGGPSQQVFVVAKSSIRPSS